MKLRGLEVRLYCNPMRSENSDYEGVETEREVSNAPEAPEFPDGLPATYDEYLESPYVRERIAYRERMRADGSEYWWEPASRSEFERGPVSVLLGRTGRRPIGSAAAPAPDPSGGISFEAFSDVFSRLYYGLGKSRVPSAPQLRVYYEGLRRFELDELRGAVEAYLSEHEEGKLPTVATLKRLAMDVRRRKTRATVHRESEPGEGGPGSYLARVLLEVMFRGFGTARTEDDFYRLALEVMERKAPLDGEGTRLLDEVRYSGTKYAKVAARAVNRAWLDT